jgi:hypothetical protein
MAEGSQESGYQAAINDAVAAAAARARQTMRRARAGYGGRGLGDARFHVKEAAGHPGGEFPPPARFEQVKKRTVGDGAALPTDWHRPP